MSTEQRIQQLEERADLLAARLFWATTELLESVSDERFNELWRSGVLELLERKDSEDQEAATAAHSMLERFGLSVPDVVPIDLELGAGPA